MNHESPLPCTFNNSALHASGTDIGFKCKIRTAVHVHYTFTFAHKGLDHTRKRSQQIKWKDTEEDVPFFLNLKFNSYFASVVQMNRLVLVINGIK